MCINLSKLLHSMDSRFYRKITFCPPVHLLGLQHSQIFLDHRSLEAAFLSEFGIHPESELQAKFKRKK